MHKVTSTGDALETVELEDEAAAAKVRIAPARGGLLTRFSVAGSPVLFMDDATLHDPSQSVRGGIPILFPIAGKLPDGGYSVGGRRYEMNQHGFARALPWNVLSSGTSDGASVTLGLDASDATRAQYPFEFALRFTYRLRGQRLSVEQRFENRGDTPMPVQPGLHPYFYVPDARKAEVRLDTDATRAYDNVAGSEVRLTAPIAFAQREVDLHLLDHHPREAVLHRPGLPDVYLEFGADQQVLIVWTLPGRDFVCVEPWSRKFAALADGTAPLIAPGQYLETTLTIFLAG